MSEFCKKHIARLSGLQLGIKIPEDFTQIVKGFDELEKFIDSENATVLYAVAEKDDCLRFFRNEGENEQYDKLIIFYKTTPCILIDENIHSSIQVSSVAMNSPALALYQVLNNVFSPLMQKKSSETNIPIQIANLQNNLRSLIFAERPQEGQHFNTEDISLTVVETLEHEVEYWKTQNDKKDRLVRKMSSYFIENLEPLAKEFSVIDVLPLVEVDDLLEKAHNIFDDIWKYQPPYPNGRMPHLMDIIGICVSKYTSKQLKQYNIWEIDFVKISELLQQHIGLGEKWLNTCQQLTEIFWPNYSPHIWTEKVYQPNELIHFVSLLKEILNFRTIHRQITRLLTKEEQEELNTKDMFKPFKDGDIFSYSDDVNKHLFKSQKQFEYLLQPAEKRVAIKLKRQLSSVNSNIRQLVYEFSRYSDLISRPVLKQTLQSERQFLLTSLHEYLRQIQLQATSENTITSSKQEIPQNVKEIMVIRQLEAKSNEVLKVSEKVLDDLPGFENLHQTVLELIKDLKQQHNELFETWCNEIMRYINDNTLSLKESDPVVRFSKTKLMMVTYNPRLVSLISEVRQLKAMGYHVPNIIDQTIQHAKNFMKYARFLEQIANFHNTIGDRMVPSQKPMMLNSAVELSKLVQEEKVVSWGEVKAVERYVETLNKAVEKLSKENSLLTSYHVQVVDKIRDLDGIDLLRDFQKWKDATKYVRNIISQVETKGFKNMQNWKNDIDKQLASILEKQYIKSLDKLHLNFQEVPVDLVYRNSTLEFSPNEENLKSTYEQQLKRYLDIPKSFKGASDMPEQIFSSILDRNQEALKCVDRHKSELFEQLAAVIKHWRSWLQLENLDTSKLTTWQHWDLHFRASKTFGQEIAKLPSSEEKVGCFVIGLSRLRSDLESHNRSYWDKLVYTLKDSIAQDVVKLQNYIDPSTAALTRQPVTLEEVGESGVSHAGILKEVPEMEETFDEMMKKSQILASWSREQVDSVNRVRNAWERLGNLLENHQHIIAKQMETIKTTLNIEKENLLKELERFEAKWQQVKPRPNSGDIVDNSLENLAKQLEDIKNKREEWKVVMERKEKLIQDFTKFNFEMPELPLVEAIEVDLSKEEESWKIFEEFYKGLEEIRNEYWIVFRKKIHSFDDFLIDWEKKLKTTENANLTVKILREISNFKDVVPALKFVRGDDFSEKHWSDTFALLKIESKPVDQILVKDFLNAAENLQNSLKELQVISKKAASEIVVRQALSELDHWDVQAKFVLASHNDSRSREMFIVKEFKEALSKIGDHQSLLQSLKGSGNYDSFSDRVNSWENKLNDLDGFLTALGQIQRKWIYLEPIFSGGTLPQEKTRFERIDKEFRHILSYIEKNVQVSAFLRYPNIRAVLNNLQEQLSRCQNSLNNFLKEKREKFPRFLFLSDDDLLEVVGQSSKEQVIQTHLKKIFAGINTIKLDQTSENITAMCSSQGEVVALSKNVNIRKPVEEWLVILVEEMQTTLKQSLVKCQLEKQAPDPILYPSQILCLAESITFTNRCENAISNMGLAPLLAKYKMQLTHYSSMEFEIDQDDHQVLELKLKALLLDTIHHISILEELLENNVTKTSDWIWQKQLRFYANSTGEVTVKMANARMEYSYEYLGNAAKLVRTPLTERCFLTLTQSLHLGMGGNPYGPAGTGKTESVKALGCLLGRQVLVFNCDEGIDSSSMGRILSGLVKTGAWGCFDEFNRLDQATLSAVSMIVHPIQEALRNNLKTLTLLEETVSVNRHCGIFITLNPAGSGYGGRNKLPDNLKQLFRPVIMTHPDNEQISRCLLYCDGFKNADLIAKKIVEVFNHSGMVLSKQQHYDWGLRAVRTILSGCGKALKKIKTSKSDCTAEDELGLVVEVIKTDTISKLTFSDGLKFVEILSDVFRGVPIKSIDNQQLRDTLKICFEESNLVVNNRQLQKCVEFLEQLNQRMGVVLVGPPSSGKTTVRNLVFKALSKLNKTVKQYEFNPKSITRPQLLGSNNNDSNQWSDGVLTNYSLQVASEDKSIWSWIVCDGDIDPEWVESLNSVLDDNRLLSFPSGWRIQFGTNVNFVFETHNLDYASPATISRMGIVFLSEQDVGIDMFVKKRMGLFPEENKTILEPLVDEFFLKALDWVTKDADTTLPRSKISVANTALSLLKNVNSNQHFPNVLVNGLGQQLQQDFREIFAQQVYEWMGQVSPPSILKSGYNKERDLVESYHTNPNITIEDVGGGLTLVETGQVKLYLEILEHWLGDDEKTDFLIVGPHGSAKSLILNSLIEKLSDVEMVTIFCSSNLLPDYVIDKLFQYCIAVNTHRGKTLKPKKGNLILYFKNLHLLKQDVWGTSMLIEFLRQILVYKGFFDKNIEFIRVENVYIVGSLQATNNISSRFLSNLHVFNVNLPEHEDVSVIFSTYLHGIIKEYYPNQNFPRAKTIKIASTLIYIYEKIKNFFTVNKAKHYVFSPHDLTVWCTNIKYYKHTEENTNFEWFLAEILSYEILKCTGDKLLNSDDKSKLIAMLDEAFNVQLNIPNITNKLINVYYIPSSQKAVEMMKFSRDDWLSTVETGITHYEREGRSLDIVTNDEILDLTSSILKSVSCPFNHIVLIGKSGLGRRSSIKIVSTIRSAKLMVVTSDKQPYFNNCIKQALQWAGLEGFEVYLQLEDNMFENDSNLNLINLLISSGEVPGLYTTAELESVVTYLKEEYNRDNFDKGLIRYFAERIMKNLHVIVCLDAGNENLSNVILNCPALSCNSIVWKNDWSEKSIKEIPEKIINKENNEATKIENNAGFAIIYKETKLNITTPSRLVSMVKLYVKTYREKLNNIETRKYKLQAGVDNLNDAQNHVSKLKKNAMEQQEKLAEKQSKANAALDMISNTMKNASSHKEEMESLKTKTEEENVQLVQRKKEIELELAEVEPLIQEARKAVGNIKAESLSEIRSLRAPPDIIRDILEGVLRLMGIQDTSWNSMKTFLSKRGVKEEIRSFDASRIQTENRQAVMKLMSVKSDSFDAKSARRASVAAAPLAAWVAANVQYSQVLDKIKPLEKEQNKLKQNLSQAELQLGELSAGLSDVDATVAKLKEQLSAYTREAAAIEIDLATAQATLATAEGLVGKLSDEYTRWQHQLSQLSDEQQKLSNDCLLAAAFVTFLSEETENKRNEFLTGWSKSIGVEYEFNFEGFFSTEREQMQWQIEGLTSDKLSIQNSIILSRVDLVPLIIDPTSKIVDWIKIHLKHKQLDSITQNSPKFNTTLEFAIRFGKVLIVEEVENVSNGLLPILRKEYILQGERRLLKIDDKIIDYHQEFTIILTTRNEQFKLTSDLAPLITVLNFTVTYEGLTEQLLLSAVKQESPELEERRKLLLRQKEELQEKQFSLQNRLLDDLGNSTGDILHNKQLLDSLNETKASSIAIEQALTESIEVQSKLKTEYDHFREMANFGSSLYFACNSFSKSNVLYVTSIKSFVRLFLKALQTFQSVDNNVESQKKYLLSVVYSHISRGVFKEDRIKFLLHFCRILFPKQVPEKEWNIFLGSVFLNKENEFDAPGWLPKTSWGFIQNIQNYLPEFYEKLQLAEYTTWKEFMTSSACENSFPQQCNKMTAFQKVLIIQALRSDRLLSGTTQAILHITGLKTVDPAILDMNQVLKESENVEPILILTTAGADPSSEVRELATKLGKKYLEVAMGDGQRNVALEGLRKCSETGDWLILKNLHLVTYWLTELCENLKNIAFNEHFRLWLISEHSETFNFVLAQNSLKIVFEAPQGLKNNMLRTYSTFGDRNFEKFTSTTARIFFVASCVHALLEERRKYIPQGWSKFYEFGYADFSTLIKLSEDIWQGHGSQVPWKYISMLCLNVYGGRIENNDDIAILESYTKKYFVDQVLSHRWRPFDLDLDLAISGSYKDYVNSIKMLPNKDKPTFFGLPENIDRSWEKQMSEKVISQLKDFSAINKAIQFKTLDKELYSKNLSTFLNLWKKLNQGKDFIRMSIPETLEKTSAVSAFIEEEFTNALLLIQNIHKCFAVLNKISKGILQAENSDLDVLRYLLKFETPNLWSNIWKGPCEADLYLKAIIDKTTMLEKLRNSPTITLSNINICSFLRPEGFLASLKQERSRSMGIPMEKLRLQSKWVGNGTEMIVLRDLLIEGGLFEGTDLKFCKENSENINKAPNCFLSWSEMTASRDEENNIDVPLYKTQKRYEKVTTLSVPCPKDRDKWILGGLAFYLE